MKEQCKNCVFCTELYVPPIKCFENIPKNAYVCTLFLEEANRVQYLGDNTGRCEMFLKIKEWKNER